MAGQYHVFIVTLHHESHYTYHLEHDTVISLAIHLCQSG